MTTRFAALLSLLMLAAAGPATAQAPAAPGRQPATANALPKVEAGWIRATVPGQSGTGAFMTLTAPEAMQLVGASTPVAGQSDVHEMKLDGDVMRMRAIARLDLPPNRAVELKPGGYHVMLQELKQPLANGTTVPLTLLLRTAQGVERRLEVRLPVLANPPGAAGAASAAMSGHKH